MILRRVNWVLNKIRSNGLERSGFKSTKTAPFENCAFSKTALFKNCAFLKTVPFWKPHFSKTAPFWKLRFLKTAPFRKLWFSKTVPFRKPRFSKTVVFENRAFSKTAVFETKDHLPIKVTPFIYLLDYISLLKTSKCGDREKRNLDLEVHSF